MFAVTKEQILECLSRIHDSDQGKDIVSAGMITGLVVKDSNVGFSIEVDPKRGAAMEPLRKTAEAAVMGLAGVTSATVVLTAHSGSGQQQQAAAPQAQPAAQAEPAPKPGIPGIKQIIAVASGKGGVGKSTTAINLAIALKATGMSVGLLDADIYGPSQPRMMGLSGQPESPDGKTIIPMENFGIKVMSMGFLVAEDTPMIWRGPMVQSALQQMLRNVAWGELDILVVDMPPGTGDAQLTMSQQVPLAGAVIVSTPQDIALLDAKKGLNMFRKVDVPVLGIIENMSTFVCPNCEHETHIFGHGGAKREADNLGMVFLGEVPLDMAIRIASDEGTPITAIEPDGAHAKAYRSIADRVLGSLKSNGRAAPSIRMN
jgi:ATP-binding protein involved in chromosome partitioning